MLDLKNRKIDKTGNIYLDDKGFLEALYLDLDLKDFNYINTESFEFYNKSCIKCEKDEWILNTSNTKDKKDIKWFMPDEYLNMDIVTFLSDKCKTQEEKRRVSEELILYSERNLLDVLKFFVYLVDHFRENNIVWGVGRGSSVASYCLYLIGVHKVNSIKYNLNIKEFIR